MRSILACEASSAARAFDRGVYVRTMWFEIEHGWAQMWNRARETRTNSNQEEWNRMCKAIPFCLGTDCKSLYDVCTKNGSMPEERRVVLDLLDVRESIETVGDQIRWIPTYHMLVDCMTKTMPPDAMIGYMKSMEYAFKYDDVIKETKREIAKLRGANREGEIPKDLESLESMSDDIKLVEHYDLYYTLFTFLLSGPSNVNLVHPSRSLMEQYMEQRKEKGYRAAYHALVVASAAGPLSSESSS